MGKLTSWLVPILSGNPTPKSEDGTNQGGGAPSRDLRICRRRVLKVAEKLLTDEFAVLKRRQRKGE